MTNIKLNTRFGELNVDPSRVITFPRGIPGFEKNTQWTLFHELDDKGERVSGVVVHLQSIDDETVSLPLTEPSLFGFNYDLVLTDSEVAEIKLEDPEDVLVLVTLSNKNIVPQSGSNLPLANMNANISAPILINTKSRIGVQKILVGRESKVDYRPSLIV
jgi:flagellar assembly factor FliW